MAQTPTEHELILLEVRELRAEVRQVLALLKDNYDTSPDEMETYLNKIGRMLASGKFGWSEKEFLQSVFDWVTQHGHITRKQMRAVDRIATAKQKPQSDYDGTDFFLGEMHG